ncbi:MAG: ComF family protein [Candidatus Edwardsbacteria bacterium]|nr:ComF family protein [Candidatus Edwardsbacteria bacterium]
MADFVFPPFCAACHGRMPEGQRGAVCSDCWDAYPRWPAGACQRCGGPAPASGAALCDGCRIPDWSCAAVRTPGPFAPPVSQAVHLMKYSDRRSVAATLGTMMAEAARSDDAYAGADLVLAVPLHPARRRDRGYNQAQLLAAAVGRALGKPSPEGVVERVRNTGTQTALDRQQRRANVDGIFRVRRPGAVSGRSVILVDDVLTTGATIGSCGRSLVDAGARAVLALTAAAAPLD